jgi:hypothetical protein
MLSLESVKISPLVYIYCLEASLQVNQFGTLFVSETHFADFLFDAYFRILNKRSFLHNSILMRSIKYC